MDEPYVVAVDLGGTNIVAALVAPHGGIVRRVRLDTCAKAGVDAVMTRIVQAVKDVQQNESVAGIGIGAAGMIQSGTGVVIHSPNLAGWRNIPLKDELKRRLNTEVHVVNDADAAAWGEYVYGAGRGTRHMICIMVGTGIGAGIVFGGERFPGGRAMAGELGHMIIDPRGPRCGCGNKGCWETFVSGTAIGRYARDAVKAGRAPLIAQLARKEGVPAGAKHVFAAARRKEKAAQAIVDKVVHYLALGLANTIHAFHPERIVIGGGVMRDGKRLVAAVRQKTRDFVTPAYRDTYAIVPAALGNDAGVLGAAALFLAEAHGPFK